MKVLVRPARAEDDVRIGELLVEAFVETYSRKMPEVRVTEERKAELRAVAEKRKIASVFVAEVDGEVIGTIAIYPPGSHRSEAWKPGSADLRHLAVDPRFQGRGVSGQLIEAAEAQAGEWGSQGICLHVRRGVHGVARIYQARGYVRDPSGDLDLPSVYLEGYYQSKTTVLFA
ncbi:MAG TPA: GNAT family N-acetyltransferase [Bdellovibrionota bacterium]|nr:GNAT family N-acetyltransferase [Bdellovibrionota bacterium]